MRSNLAMPQLSRHFQSSSTNLWMTNAYGKHPLKCSDPRVPRLESWFQWWTNLIHSLEANEVESGHAPALWTLPKQFYQSLSDKCTWKTPFKVLRSMCPQTRKLVPMVNQPSPLIRGQWGRIWPCPSSLDTSKAVLTIFEWQMHVENIL